MFRQEGDSQVEDRRWYKQDQTWEAEIIPSDIDTRGRDSRPPTAESTPGDSGEQHQGRLPSKTYGIISE